MANPEEQRLQSILDRAAVFNTLTLPDPARPSAAIPMPNDPSSLAGVQVRGLGHRFDVRMAPITPGNGVRASNAVGKEAIGFSCRWLLMPHDFGAMPGKEPPPTAFDPSKSQRFALMDAELDFGGGDRFVTFGTGQTFPMKDPGSGTIRIAANGATLQGTGRFQGLFGNYVLMGFFTPPADFSINLMLRIPDPDGSLLTESLPALQAIPFRARDTTYLILRTINPSPWARIGTSSRGIPNEVKNLQYITGFRCDFTVGDSRGPRCQREIGPHQGFHRVELSGNLMPTPEHPGTAVSPLPFSDQEEFYFYDTAGEAVGSFEADVIDGRTIMHAIEGIPPEAGPQLAGGFAPINYGTGYFEGVEGMVTNVATGIINPDLLELIYMMAFKDPRGKYRA